MEKPLVTFGFVNCNRLFYLKSCVESAIETTKNYPNKEFIIVDNASKEKGTEEYLLEKEKQGFKVIRQKERNPSNEFAIGLNLICKSARGKYIIPLQGDSQFVLNDDWLNEYVNFYEKDVNNQIGCITLDAQRRVTNESHKYSQVFKINSSFGFVADYNRPPTCGAGDVMYSKKILDIILPWEENMKNFEYVENAFVWRACFLYFLPNYTCIDINLYRSKRNKCKDKRRQDLW